MTALLPTCCPPSSRPTPDVEETNLLSVPLYHIAGLQAALAAIYGGRTLAIMRQFDPEEWLTLAQDCRVNRAMLVPTMLKRLLDYPDFHRYDLSSLRVITYGAAPMPLPVIRQAIEEFPRRPLHQRLRPDRNRLYNYNAAPRKTTCWRARRRRWKPSCAAYPPSANRWMTWK